MSITTKLFPHSLIGIVSVLPALLVMPALAGDPNTSAANPAWVFGDINLNGAPVALATIGGRRMEWNGGKYKNDLPKYNMIGRSLSVVNSDAYVGPVTVTFGELDPNATFKYNYQWELDGNPGNDDVDLAKWANVGWNESYESVLAKLSSDDVIGEVNAGYTVGGVYMFSRLNNEDENAGKMSIDHSTLAVNGSTIYADAISISNGSELTFVNEDTLSLLDFDGGDIDSDGKTTLNVRVMSVDGSRFVINDGAGLTLNATENAIFKNTSGAEKGGVVYNKGTATLTGKFDGNSATDRGGAIYNYGTMNINRALFTSNMTTSVSYPSQGGAIYNTGDAEYLDKYGVLFISNTTFGDKNDNTKGNIAMQGGAISGESGNGYRPELVLNNTNFYYNKAQSAADSGLSALGGAIHNSGGIVTIDGANEFKGNVAEGYAAEGGAIYNSNKMTFKGTSTFDSNIVEDTDGANGGIGGAISNAGELTFEKKAIFTNNQAVGVGQTSGGALANTNVVNIKNGADFSENEAMYGGALFNFSGTMNLTDVKFTDNTAGDEGGAIFTYRGTVNINAKNDDVIFSGNTANGSANDITTYSNAVINLNAASGRKILMDGGINGPSGTLNINSVSGNKGVVNIAGDLENQTITVYDGELALSKGLADGSNLTGSTVAVNSNARLNTQDSTINDYSSFITLANGSKLLADANATSADKFTINSGDTVTLMGLKMLVDLGDDTPVALNLADAGKIAIGDGVKVYTTAHKYDLTGNDSNNGVLTVARNGAGGLSAAANDTGNVTYAITGNDNDDTVGSDTLIENANLVVKGAGTEAGDTGVELDAKLAVAEKSSLTIEDTKFADAGSGAIENRAGGLLTILNSKIDVDITNSGIMYSDPTYYSAQVVNSGTATFDGDTFDTGSSLVNNATVNLLNGTTFVSGVAISGTGVTNLVNGTTHFNDTASSNTVNLASGADFDGVLASTGVLNTQNSNIDTITGSVSGGDLYVDANLVSGSIDSFAATTGANVKGIKLANAGYGTAGSVALDMGGASLGNDVQIEGINYYTKVFQSGNNVVFGDKLMNTSGMYAQLGSWNAGNYIGASSTYDPVTASYTSAGQTVGGALTALDTAVKTNADAIATKTNVAGGNAFTGAQTITNTSDVADAVVSGITVTASNTTDSKSNVFAVTSDAVTVNGNAVLTTASALNGANLTAGSVGTDALAANIVTNAKIADDAVTLDKIADAAMVQGTGDYATSTLLTSKGYVDQALATNTATITGVSDRVMTLENAGYQTAANVTTAINNAAGTGLTSAAGVLSVNTATAVADGNMNYVTSDLLYDQGYQTAANVNTLIANAVTDGGAVDNAIDNAIGALDLANTYEAKGSAAALANGAVKDNTDAIAVLNGTAADAGSVDYKIAQALAGNGTQESAYQTQADVVAIAEEATFTANASNNQSAALNGAATITDAVNNVATAVDTLSGTVAGATTMGTNNANFDDNVSVVAAVEALDEHTGKVHGLVTNDGDGVTRIHGTRTSGNYVAKNVDANTGAYTGNLAIGTTIEDHLISLDNTIGSMSTLDTSNGVLDNTASVAQNLQNLDTALANVRAGSLADANAYTDRRVESLDKNLSSGVAGAVALSSVAVSGVERGEVSVGAGYGYFNGQSAAAFGAAMGLSNRWSVNAGAGISNADVSFRAGTNYKFRLF